MARVSQRTATSIRFAAKVSSIDASTIVRLPKEASAGLPSRGQVAVRGSINGHDFETVLEPDGLRGHWLRVDRQLQQGAGLAVGDKVSVVVAATPEWPEPDVPADLAGAVGGRLGRVDRRRIEAAYRAEIDGFIAPRPPSLPKDTPNVGWLFPDPVAAAKDYFKRTGVFPIMHLVGVRRTLAEQHPWLPGAVFKAFSQAKDKALELLGDTSATKVTLPFVEERLSEARTLMGEDFWAYGLEANRKTLEVFLRHHHAQGLSSRLVTPEELFHPGTLESFKL